MGEVGGESGVVDVSDWAAFWKKESDDAFHTLLGGVTFAPSVETTVTGEGTNNSVVGVQMGDTKLPSFRTSEANSSDMETIRSRSMLSPTVGEVVS